MLERWREPHPLEPALWKVRRAKKHLDSLNDYTAKFNEIGGIRLRTRESEDRSSVEYVLEAAFPPFIDYSLTIGEFAYQVRSSLDQAIYAACDFTGLDEEAQGRAVRNSAFPVLRSVAPGVIAGRLNYVRPDIRDGIERIVEAAQPYHSATPELHYLSLLDEINVLDKHRVLRPSRSTLTISKEGLDPRVEVTPSRTGGDGGVIARVPHDLVEVTAFPDRVRAGVVVPLERVDSIPLEALGALYGYVVYDILRQFLEFFPPLPRTVQWPSPETSSGSDDPLG